MAPISPNCNNISAVHSAFAPESSKTLGFDAPNTGSGVAIAGRATPLIRPMRNSAAAIVAPVFPAPTMAQAAPSRTASAARTTDESFILRTLVPASAPMAMTSDAAMIGRSSTSANASG